MSKSNGIILACGRFPDIPEIPCICDYREVKDFFENWEITPRDFEWMESIRPPAARFYVALSSGYAGTD